MGLVNASILTEVVQIELTSPAASEQSRADCEAICKLGLKAKVGAALLPDYVHR